MKKIIIPVIIILSAALLTGMQFMPRKEEAKAKEKPAPSQERQAPKPVAEKVSTEEEYITASGRLILEHRKKGDTLVLHGKDAVLYRITGGRTDELKGLFQELGRNNLVSVGGVKSPFASSISCKHSYGYSDEGKKTVETYCVSYHDLKIDRIIDSKISGEEMPPPKRDLKEEERARQRALSQEQERNMLRLISIQGEITFMNIRSPIKTVEVSFAGRDGKPVKKTLLLTANTVIAKKSISSDTLVTADEESLHTGQEVAVEYSRTERTAEAIAITILED
jgi:hypothetical protein